MSSFTLPIDLTDKTTGHFRIGPVSLAIPPDQIQFRSEDARRPRSVSQEIHEQLYPPHRLDGQDDRTLPDRTCVSGYPTRPDPVRQGLEQRRAPPSAFEVLVRDQDRTGPLESDHPLACSAR